MAWIWTMPENFWWHDLSKVIRWAFIYHDKMLYILSLLQLIFWSSEYLFPQRMMLRGAGNVVNRILNGGESPRICLVRREFPWFRRNKKLFLSESCWWQDWSFRNNCSVLRRRELRMLSHVSSQLIFSFQHRAQYCERCSLRDIKDLEIWRCSKKNVRFTMFWMS